MRYLKKKSYHLEEVDSEGTWALSYGDMITLLLSFFVIFFTTDPKMEKVSKLNDFLSFSLEEIGQEKRLNSFKIDNFKDLDIKTHVVNQKVIVTFGKFSFFKSGQEELTPEGREVLKKFANKYVPFAGNYSLSIKGFTDVRPILHLKRIRRFKDNLELSVLRSVSAMRALQSDGIPLSRMEIAGAGEMKSLKMILPFANNLSPDEHLKYSRTIVIVISPEKESWL